MLYSVTISKYEFAVTSTDIFDVGQSLLKIRSLQKIGLAGSHNCDGTPLLLFNLHIKETKFCILIMMSNPQRK